MVQNPYGLQEKQISTMARVIAMVRKTRIWKPVSKGKIQYGRRHQHCCTVIFKCVGYSTKSGKSVQQTVIFGVRWV